MNKYIIEILKIQSSIILPGFGSLMISNSKTGKIVFNPHLKFNDGALARYIAEKENLDVQASQNQVAKFVREIEAELAKGNSYDMFEFGSFKKSAAGDLTFVMDPKGAVIPNDAPKTEKPAPAAKPVEKVETKKEEPVKEEKPKDDKAAKKAKKEAESLAAKVAEDKAKADKAAEKAAADAKKLAAEKAAADAKTAEKTKAEADKVAEAKKIEEQKQDKNVFVPSADKTAEKPKETAKPEKTGAIERALGDPIKAAEIKTESKKETPQEKNVFTPAEEKKAAGTSAAAAAALAAAGQKPADKAAETQKVVDPKAKKQKPSQKPKKEKKDGEKKKKNRWPLIIILIILIGGGTTAGILFKTEIMAFINGTEVADNDEHGEDGDEHGDKSHEDETLITDQDSTDTSNDELSENIEDEVIEDEVVEEVIETVVDNSTGGSYHVIGNAFAESGNADAYVSQMKTKGYGSAKVLGRFDNLYMVSIQQFDSQSAAASGASNAGDGAWVFKWPK